MVSCLLLLTRKYPVKEVANHCLLGKCLQRNIEDDVIYILFKRLFCSIKADGKRKRGILSSTVMLFLSVPWFSQFLDIICFKVPHVYHFFFPYFTCMHFKKKDVAVFLVVCLFAWGGGGGIFVQLLPKSIHKLYAHISILVTWIKTDEIFYFWKTIKVSAMGCCKT